MLGCKRTLELFAGCHLTQAKKILGEIGSIINKLSLAFGESRKPTPPTVELIVFFEAEDVTS